MHVVDTALGLYGTRTLSAADMTESRSHALDSTASFAVRLCGAAVRE